MNLAKKSIYTAYSKVISIVLSFAFQLIMTPFLLSNLGRSLYATYALINKVQSYFSLIDFRPTAILRYKIASIQTIDDLPLKKEYVGASLFVSLAFFPIFISLGLVIAYLFPTFLDVAEKDLFATQVSVLIVSLVFSVKGFLTVPDAILRGNNLEYKLWHVDPIKILFLGLLIFFFLLNGYGLIAVFVSILLATFFEAFIKLVIQLKNMNGYFPKKPSRKIVTDFFSNGSWYLGSSLFSQIINSSDVFLIGYLFGLENVVVYALSKSMVFRIFESMSNIYGSITSSIGQLISQKKNDEILNIWSFSFRYNFIMIVVLCTYFVYFNAFFLQLWVGGNNYIGMESNFLLCLTASLSFLILCNEVFINSFQDFKSKTIVLFICTSLFLLTVIPFGVHWGMKGVIVSLGLTKLVQFFLYLQLLKKHIALNMWHEFKANKKVLLFWVLLSCICYLMIDYVGMGWGWFILSSFTYFLLALIGCWYYVFKKGEKVDVITKFRRRFL